MSNINSSSADKNLFFLPSLPSRPVLSGKSVIGRRFPIKFPLLSTWHDWMVDLDLFRLRKEEGKERKVGIEFVSVSLLRWRGYIAGRCPVRVVSCVRGFGLGTPPSPSFEDGNIKYAIVCTIDH